MVDIFAIVMNKTLSTGILPDVRKTGLVTPLMKMRGLDSITSNYKLVTNLCFISKVIEKASFNFLFSQFNKNKFFFHDIACKRILQQKHILF